MELPKACFLTDRTSGWGVEFGLTGLTEPFTASFPEGVLVGMKFERLRSECNPLWHALILGVSLL